MIYRPYRNAQLCTASLIPYPRKDNVLRNTICRLQLEDFPNTIKLNFWPHNCAVCVMMGGDSRRELPVVLRKLLLTSGGRVCLPANSVSVTYNPPCNIYHIRVTSTAIQI